MKHTSASSPRTDLSYNEKDDSVENPGFDELDYLYECDPEDYSARWQSLKIGRRLEYNVSSQHLTMDMCHSYFSSKKIHVVASGISGEHQIMKFFLMASKSGEFCLSEVKIDLLAKRSILYIKSENHSNHDFFIDAINMTRLISSS